jgi:putative NADH-flavin reductase
MHVLIIGGTGRTGSLVTTELLARGHTVTALVRNPSKLAAQPGLTPVKGSAMLPSEVDLAFTSSATPIDAVIVTLNAQRASDSPFAAPLAPPRMMADSNANLVAAMKTHGVHKIVTMSAFGVGDSNATINWMLRLVLRKTNMAAQFEDHDLVDEQMREHKKKDIRWVLVRPVMLGEGPKAAIKDLGDRGEGAGMLSKISRESVAGFLVDAVEKSEYDWRSPVISN